MLIDEFKKQTNNTILDFLAQLGGRPEVYSVLTWYLCEDINWQLIYATQNEIVLVYIDYTNGIGSIEKDEIIKGISGDEKHHFKYINVKDKNQFVDGRLSPIECVFRSIPVHQFR